MSSIPRLLRADERGTTSIEYCFIAALIACGLVASLGTVGSRLGTVFSAVTSALGGGADTRTAPPPATTNRLGG